MKKILTSLLAGIVLIFSEPAEAQNFNTIKNEKTAILDTLYSELYESAAFNGNILVAENGNIIFQKSYGLGNEETKEPLNIETRFELASVSKQFTAMGIVQLQKEGKLSYEDEISKYIPELKNYKGITIKHLLIHTGGLPDYMKLADENWDKTKIATNNDIIQLFQKLQPEKKFEPNQKWDYSNTGYLLLGTIIERVSGKTFEAYLKEKIFIPLGMNNTFVYRRRFQPINVKNYAQGYIYSDSLKRKILPDELGKDFYVVYLDGIVGDGMVSSNLHDLLKWDRALYKHKFITEEDKKLIFASYPTDDGNETDYGFGWFTAKDEQFGRMVRHSGSWAGYITFIERHLDNDKTIIILQNNATKATEVPVKNTRKILYGLPVEKPLKLSKAVLLKYAGTYLTNNGTEKEIIFEEEQLWVPMNPEVKLDLIPVSENIFIVNGFLPEVTYEFILDGNGEVEKYRVQQPEQGLDQTLIRKK